ncbi:T9SS type A sorting domain-containing protein [Dysgonomonas sp. 25]|uniref:T9SS type A sorting domain-containing protein n=1 Tax=Dysgonomonas sp. 25 TaxID=2302933 RepID=UPI0013D7CACF|nr:T9SS type A sorting domain-containing protein [Dysgonomonas sp. 25]
MDACSDTTSESNSIVYKYIPSAPHILSVDTLLEICHGDDNAQLILNFDRALYTGEKVYFGEVETGSDTLVLKGIELNIDPVTFKSNPIINLPSGAHIVGVYGTYQYGVGVGDTTNTYNQGANHRYTITIPQRPKVSYKVFQDSVHCHGGIDGRIKIKASGGTGTYYAELYELGQRGTLFRTPVTFTDSVYYFTDLAKGDYEIYLKDSNGCEPDTAFLPVSVSEPARALRIFDDDYHEPKAFGYSDGEAWAFIDGGSGAYSIVWKDSVSGTVLKTETLIRLDSISSVKSTLFNIPKGKYTIEVYDQNWNPAYLLNPSNNQNYCGCQASKTIDVDQPPKLLVEIKEHHYVTCNGDNDGELIAKVTGGRPHLLPKKPYDYEWRRITPDSTTILETYTSVNDSILTNLYSGHYMICVTDSNHIQATSRIFHLVQPEPLVVSTNVRQHLLCDGYKIGEIEAVVTGGTPPYEYFWETGDTTHVVTGLGKGIYSVFVRDARYKDNPRHYCSMEAFGEVTSPNGMNITSTIKEPTCSAYADGEITLTITGGVTPYTFLWSDGATTQNRTGIPAGDYTITITDANGCSLTDSYSLYEPEPLAVDLGNDITLCKDRSVTLNSSIGQDSITYLWTKDGSILSTDSVYTISEAGNYRITITNQDGCSAYDEITVRQSNDELTADFVVATEIPNNKEVYAVNITNMAYDRIEWIMPDEATISEQTEHQIYFSIPYNGHYTIGMIGYRGACQDILYKTIEVKDAKDIDDYKEVEPFIKKFIVYPNPNDGNFSAEIELCEQMNYTLYLYDGNGNLIETKNVRNTKGTTTQFNASGKGAGVYLLRFASQKMNSTFKVVIK